MWLNTHTHTHTHCSSFPPCSHISPSPACSTAMNPTALGPLSHHQTCFNRLQGQCRGLPTESSKHSDINLVSSGGRTKRTAKDESREPCCFVLYHNQTQHQPSNSASELKPQCCKSASGCCNSTGTSSHMARAERLTQDWFLLLSQTTTETVKQTQDKQNQHLLFI